MCGPTSACTRRPGPPRLLLPVQGTAGPVAREGQHSSSSRPAGASAESGEQSKWDSCPSQARAASVRACGRTKRGILNPGAVNPTTSPNHQNRSSHTLGTLSPTLGSLRCQLTVPIPGCSCGLAAGRDPVPFPSPTDTREKARNVCAALLPATLISDPQR